MDYLWLDARYFGINLFYRYIDQGKNPQLYTKDCMEKALAKNEAVKGKIDALKVSNTVTSLVLLQQTSVKIIMPLTGSFTHLNKMCIFQSLITQRFLLVSEF